MRHLVRSTQTRFSQRGSWLAGCLVLVSTLALAACQPVTPPPANAAPAAAEAAATTAPVAETAAPPAVTITARDFAFDMPAELPSGLVSLTMTNVGEANHHGIVLRLREGVTLDQVKEALLADAAGEQDNAEGGEDDQFDLSFMLPDTDPGASNEVTVDLAPGTWVIFSVSVADMTMQDMTSDWERGSIQLFTVTDESSGAAAPEADVVLTIGPDDADMPSELSAGQHTVQVVNASGADNGYAFFLKLGDDTTMEDILAMFDAFFSGAEVEKMPQFSAVGGLMGYDLSDSFYTTIDFEPGNYVAITSVDATDFPYSGMAKSFVVK